MDDAAALPARGTHGGPQTQEGKGVVRWNATRHGIRSPEPVVPGLEKAEEWQEHRAGVLDSLSPGHLEEVLAKRVALLSWRLHRVTRYETAAITLCQEKVEEDLHKRSRILRSVGDNPYASTHPQDIRFEARYTKRAHYVLKRFSHLELGNTLKAEDASSVVWGVLMAARKVTEEEIDADSLASLPEDSDVYELPPMKASAVRWCVQEIATRAGADPDELLEAAMEDARWEAARAARKESMEGDVSRLSRERILPSDDTLQKVARYEAHSVAGTRAGPPRARGPPGETLRPKLSSRPHQRAGTPGELKLPNKLSSCMGSFPKPTL